MAYPHEPRLLFRVEQNRLGTQILVQSGQLPDWHSAFDDFAVLQGSPESKEFSLTLLPEAVYRFRLLANPTVTREGKRLGLLKEEEQLLWLTRKLEKSGCLVLGCHIQDNGLKHSGKNPYKQLADQTHLSVLFDGILRVKTVEELQQAVLFGIGPAKGYGFGLLSLAIFQEGISDI
jgi:CRISPR system Cascade subunit CasE